MHTWMMSQLASTEIGDLGKFYDLKIIAKANERRAFHHLEQLVNAQLSLFGSCTAVSYSMAETSRNNTNDP